MFFWVAVCVVLLVVVTAVSWGARGMSGRVHEPGTQRLLRRAPTGAETDGSA
ncbi:MAG: hypothetical protein WB441_09735 [Nocardioidaceae bacterium]